MFEILMIYMALLLALFLIGQPVAFALGAVAIVGAAYQFGMDITYGMFAQRMVSGINNFTILAVPFFLFAARVMNTSGVTERILRFADACVGYWKGGLGQTNILASMIFAGMSGAALSDVAGLGVMEIEAMEKAGYEKDFSVAVTAASSIVGPIIPPSIPMVFFAVQGGVSVGALFLGGVVPGVVMGGLLMLMVWHYAGKGKCPPPRRFPPWNEFCKAFCGGLVPLLTPIIIIGGIYSGFCTPTEAAAMAAFYGLAIGIFVYRELTLKQLAATVRHTMRDTVAMAIIVACTYPYAWLIVTSGLSDMFRDWLLATTDNPIVVLLLINVFLLIVGCFLEGCCAILVLTPILLPVVTGLGISPVHFGVLMVLNLMIGLLTPPFGLVLFALAKVIDMPLERVIRATMPFLIPLFASLLLVTLIPGLVTFLPRLAGFAVD